MTNIVRLLAVLGRINPAVWDAIFPHGPVGPAGRVALNPQPLPPKEAMLRASAEVAHDIASAAGSAEADGGEPGRLVSQVIDDWCGTRPRPFPWPHPFPFPWPPEPEPHPELGHRRLARRRRADAGPGRVAHGGRPGAGTLWPRAPSSRSTPASRPEPTRGPARRRAPRSPFEERDAPVGLEHGVRTSRPAIDCSRASRRSSSIVMRSRRRLPGSARPSETSTTARRRAAAAADGTGSSGRRPDVSRPIVTTRSRRSPSSRSASPPGIRSPITTSRITSNGSSESARVARRRA